MYTLYILFFVKLKVLPQFQCERTTLRFYQPVWQCTIFSKANGLLEEMIISSTGNDTEGSNKHLCFHWLPRQPSTVIVIWCLNHVDRIDQLNTYTY